MFKQLLRHFHRPTGDHLKNSESDPLPPLDTPIEPMTSLQNVTGCMEPVNPHRVHGLQIASSFCDLLLGEVISDEAEYSPGERQLIDRMKRFSDADILRSAALPRLPAIIPQILGSLRDPEASHGKIVELVQQDPAVAGEVLKLANSAYFRRTSGPIDSIERAVFAIGQEGLRTLVSTSIMKPILQVKPTPDYVFGQHLWQHAIDCAVVCREIASDGPHAALTAYLLGLIHDVGKLALLQACIQAGKVASHDGPLRLAVCKPLVMRQSAQLSLAIATDWQFPQALLKVLEAQIDPSDSVDLMSLEHILFLANCSSEVYRLQQAGLYTVTQGTEFMQWVGLAPKRWSTVTAVLQSVQAF